ncbi:ER membrane protein complex subunit 5-like [Mercenaria mercenaria]|uniref:ER membrane protein complex subunit 5-like n=1 Tax=Mercenaria mercenaria TaxID=6596 RepID=UPI001E1D3EEB|nr:ER membrane protein complex subunit 5-like [Mercenaria mercenaria]
MNFYKLCVAVGLLALLHAAYSAAQHRSYLRLTEQEFTSLPWDILIQCLLSLLLVIHGVVHIAGSFREIRASADLDHKTWDMLGNRQGFLSFNHRGKALYRESSGE